MPSSLRGSKFDELGEIETQLRTRLRDFTDAVTRPRGRSVVADLAAKTKSLGDEALLWSRRSMRARPIDSARMLSAEREIAAALELYERCGWLDDPTSFHPKPPPASPRFSKPSLSIGSLEQMTFESGYSPEFEDPARARWLGVRENRTAHSWALRNSDDTSRWIVCVPGLGTGSSAIDLAAFDAHRLHRELGLNVVVYVPPMHGPRRATWLGSAPLLEEYPLDYVHFCSQAVWDLRRIFGWIRDQGARGSGVYGLALGTAPVGLLSNLEPDLSCAIAGMPVAEPGEQLDPYCEFVEQETGQDRRVVKKRLERLYSPVSPYSSACAIPRQRRYVVAGLADRVVPIDAARRFHEHWEHPDVAWHPGSHTSYARERDVRLFVEGALVENRLASFPLGRDTRVPASFRWSRS